MEVKQIKEAISARIKIIGENAAQEVFSKINELGPVVTFYFMGHLQTNQMKDCVGHFDLIYSVDSV